MGKVIAIEHPELQCRRFDLDPAGAEGSLDLLMAEMLAPGAEDEIVERSGRRLVPRLARGAPGNGALQLPRAEAYQLQPGTAGSLDALGFAARAIADPGPGEVQIE